MRLKPGSIRKDSTLKNIEPTGRQQLRAHGRRPIDWDYEVMSCLPDYYKWTQWMFVQTV